MLHVALPINYTSWYMSREGGLLKASKDQAKYQLVLYLTFLSHSEARNF